jgi:hypothetical protein
MHKTFGAIPFLAIAGSLLVFGLAPLSLRGQAGANASIVGKVTDDSGAAVPNVLVTVTSPQLQVPQVTALSDAEGAYKVVELPAPGVYHVAFSLQGFQTFARDGLNLSVGFAARVDAVMKVGAVTQTVEVTGASPVVDTVNNAGETTIPKEQLQSAPRGAALQELLPMVAGVNLQGKPDVGDSNLATRATAVTYGIPLQATLAVEGIDTNTDKSQDTTAYLDAFALAEVEFKTSGNNADVAFAGVDQVAVMKSGGNAFHGDARFAYENPRFQANNINAALAGPPSNLKFANPLADPGYYEYAADLGGRIIRDKLWFYGGYSKQYVNQGMVGFVSNPGVGCAAVVAWIAAQCGTAKAATLWNDLPEWNGKLSYQFRPSIKLIGSYMGSSKHSLTSPGATPVLPQNQFEVNPAAAWKGEVQVVREKWLLDAVYGFGGSQPAYTPEPASQIAKYGWTQGAGFAGDPPEEDLFNKLYTGTNYQASLLHIFNRHELAGTFSYLPAKPFLGGTHQLKAGTTWTFEEGDTQETREYPSGSYLLLFNSPNASANTPTPFELTAYNYPVKPHNLLHSQGYFVTDTWTVKRVALNLGLRTERYHAFYPNQTATAGQFASVFPTQNVPNTSLLTWIDVVPRAGIAWDVNGTGKTVVKTSFGMFGDTMGYLYGNLYNPAAVQSKTYSWNGPCVATPATAAVEWSCDVTPGYLATLPSLTPISQTGGSSQVLNTNLKENFTYEYVARVERQLVPNVAVSIGYVRHVLYNLYNSETNGGSLGATVSYNGSGINVGHPYSSYTLPATFAYKLNGVTSAPVTVYTYPTSTVSCDQNLTPLCTANEILNTPSSRPDIYNTLELTATKRYSKNWNALVSFWTTKDHRWLQGLAGIAGSPNDDPYPIDNTWNWDARGTVDYRLPMGFTVSSFFRATSGTYGQLTSTFSGTGLNGQKLNQASVTMRLGPFGQFQGPAIQVLNFKGAKQFKLGESRSIEANAEVFNVLNGSSAVTTSYLASTFGVVSNIVSARVLRLGVEFSF